ncbi:hypothetical protein PCI56_06960 [Plesiomonas shigelloides subsp. oncorhynchi]|nr:hypothetical protein [Plesiomonas shigelloides]
MFYMEIYQHVRSFSVNPAYQCSVIVLKWWRVCASGRGTCRWPKIEHRAAQGDVTQFGGARRLTEEQTAALRASLSDKQVKT